MADYPDIPEDAKTPDVSASRPRSSTEGGRPQRPAMPPPAATSATLFPTLEATTTSSSRPRSDSVRSRQTRPMRLRRIGSSQSNALRPLSTAGALETTPAEEGRRRSLSAPQRPLSLPAGALGSVRRQQSTRQMPSLAEEGSHGETLGVEQTEEGARSRRESEAASTAAEIVLGRKRRSTSTSRPPSTAEHYDMDVVDLLDVIDPEVSTLTTLNNFQNSFFVPNLGRFLNRQPTYQLTRPPTALSRIETADETSDVELKPTQDARPDSQMPSLFGDTLTHSHSISSVLSESRYAVLPHGVVLDGWSEEDKADLNDHVRHLLHSRKAKFRRSMRAFGKYVRTPLGFFVTTYAFLITFWGAAWVLFIIGWLSAGDRQSYFIEICDQVLTALFCVVGIGLAPFRAVDTYHMAYIAKYHFKTLRLRRERGMRDLEDPNDLPEVAEHDADEHGKPKKKKAAKAEGPAPPPPVLPEEAVLSDKEQHLFEHHRAKFCRSHTFYKPHETFTHRAFSINLLITVVVLLDCHSCFQMALGGTTWGIYYKRRPKALTAVILTCSICCNIAGGITISVGDHKSRKREVVERLFRQALTEEALQKVERKRQGLTHASAAAKLEAEEAAAADAADAADGSDAARARHAAERAQHEADARVRAATLAGMVRP